MVRNFWDDCRINSDPGIRYYLDNDFVLFVSGGDKITLSSAVNLIAFFNRFPPSKSPVSPVTATNGLGKAALFELAKSPPSQ